MNITERMVLVGCLRFAVDLLLLAGTNRLTDGGDFASCVLAAMIGGAHGFMSMFPGFSFLRNVMWYLVCLCVICLFAFGWKNGASRRWGIFILLYLALHAAVNGIAGSRRPAAALILAAAVVACVTVLCRNPHQNRLIPLFLRYKEQCIRLTALYDTGNQLRDPVTGQGVVVIGAEAASLLTGLTRQQLRDPIQTVASGVLPGLRLIPYRSIGQANGMMLAMRFPDSLLNGKKLNVLVAFAPAGLDCNEEYQALAGGYCA